MRQKVVPVAGVTAALFGLVGSACAGGAARPALVPPVYEDDPAAHVSLMAESLAGYRASFVLTWQGARIGDVRERFDAVPGGRGAYRFERSERVVVRRAGAVATATTRITVDLDEALTPRSVRVDRSNGHGVVRAEAVRMPDQGWRIIHGGAAARLVDGAAVPSTLVPLIVGAGGARPGVAYRGPVLVEGAGLALAHLEVTISDDGELARARFRTAAGDLRGEARLDSRGFIAEGGRGAALSSRRASEEELAVAFEPPEIVEAAAVAVAGKAPARAAAGGPVRLTVSGVRAPAPTLEELPEQTIVDDGGIWTVTIAPTEAPTRGAERFREVKARTNWVSKTIQDDLRVAALTAEEVLAVRRGDCTAHAIVLAHDLEERGFETRLVTGFVLDGDALKRHRWVIVKIGLRWIPVDPMFDEAPARPTHLALAVHGSSPDELAFVDDVAFAGWGQAIASW